MEKTRKQNPYKADNAVNLPFELKTKNGKDMTRKKGCKNIAIVGKVQNIDSQEML